MHAGLAHRKRKDNVHKRGGCGDLFLPAFASHWCAYACFRYAPSALPLCCHCISARFVVFSLRTVCAYVACSIRVSSFTVRMLPLHVACMRILSALVVLCCVPIRFRCAFQRFITFPRFLGIKGVKRIWVHSIPSYQ